MPGRLLTLESAVVGEGGGAEGKRNKKGLIQARDGNRQVKLAHGNESVNFLL